jgi:transcriptional regulator with XRE-family HTH domain
LWLSLFFPFLGLYFALPVFGQGPSPSSATATVRPSAASQKTSPAGSVTDIFARQTTTAQITTNDVTTLIAADGDSKAELAERAGVGAKYVGEIERGRTNPTIRLVRRLGGALDVEVFELFLFLLTDNEHDGKARVQLLRLLRNRTGKELERAAQIFRLFEE